MKCSEERSGVTRPFLANAQRRKEKRRQLTIRQRTGAAHVSLTSAAQYSSSRKEIKFFYNSAGKDATFGEAGIFEEFFHAGQDDYYSSRGMSRSLLADEVEAKAANILLGYKDASAKKSNYSSISNYFKTGKKDKNFSKEVDQLITEVYESYSKALGEEWAKENKPNTVDKKTVFEYLERKTNIVK